MFWFAAFGMVYLVILAAILIGSLESKRTVQAAARAARRAQERSGTA